MGRTSALQVGPTFSKDIALDLNSSASQWQEEFDRLFPPAPSTDIGGKTQVLGPNQKAAGLAWRAQTRKKKKKAKK